MKKGYKLTKTDQTTRNNTKFKIGVPVHAIGTGTKLCSNGWIHFYVNPVLAVLMNPIHANFDPFLLFECETSDKELHEPLKSGCKTLTITKQISIPIVTITNRIAFGILCAKCVYKNVEWNIWADKWLSNTSESRSAYVVSSYAIGSTVNTAYYAISSAAYATDAAAYAISSAACADAAACVADATYVAAYAAYADADATCAAYYAAAACADAAYAAAAYATDANLDFVMLAHQALLIK